MAIEKEQHGEVIRLLSRLYNVLSGQELSESMSYDQVKTRFISLREMLDSTPELSLCSLGARIAQSAAAVSKFPNNSDSIKSNFFEAVTKLYCVKLWLDKDEEAKGLARLVDQQVVTPAEWKDIVGTVGRKLEDIPVDNLASMAQRHLSR